MRATSRWFFEAAAEGDVPADSDADEPEPNRPPLVVAPPLPSRNELEVDRSDCCCCLVPADAAVSEPVEDGVPVDFSAAAPLT